MLSASCFDPETVLVEVGSIEMIDVEVDIGVVGRSLFELMLNSKVDVVVVVNSDTVEICSDCPPNLYPTQSNILPISPAYTLFSAESAL